MSNQKNRNYGIDFLRIFSMYLILILHILGQGGILGAAKHLSGQYSMAWLLEIMAYCAVNCYGLISGYVGIDGKYKYTNLIMTWLQVAFYTIGFSVIFLVAKLETFTIGKVVVAFTPIMQRSYWYFSSYVGLFLLIPLLNTAINHLNKKQLQAILVVCIFFFSFASAVFGSGAFTLGGGYTTIWLVILYVIGAYLKRYGWERFSFQKAGVLYIGCVALTWMDKVGAQFVTRHLYGNPQPVGYLVNYISPTILLISIILLVGCSKVKFSERACKWIGFFSPLSFGVYLIHVNPYVWNHVMLGSFKHYAAFPVMKMAGAVFGTAVVLLVGCMLIDKVRLMVFEGLRLRERIWKVEEKLIGDLWR